MFESLNESIKTDERRATPKERFIRWVAMILGVAVLLLGGLYLFLHYLQTS